VSHVLGPVDPAVNVLRCPEASGQSIQ
jgi:hypothetical protein